MVNALRYNAYLVLAIGLALSMPVLADTSTRVHKFDGTVSQLPECLENEPKTDCYAEVTTPDYRYRGDWKYGEIDGYGIIDLYSGEHAGKSVISSISKGVRYGGYVIYDTNTRDVLQYGKAINGQFVPTAPVAPVDNGPSLLERLGNWGRSYQQYEQQNRTVQVPPSYTPPAISAPPSTLNIYDQNGNPSGRIDNGGGFNSQGSVYDNNGNYIGKVR